MIEQTLPETAAGESAGIDRAEVDRAEVDRAEIDRVEIDEVEIEPLEDSAEIMSENCVEATSIDTHSSSDSVLQDQQFCGPEITPSAEINKENGSDPVRAGNMEQRPQLPLVAVGEVSFDEVNFEPIEDDALLNSDSTPTLSRIDLPISDDVRQMLKELDALEIKDRITRETKRPTGPLNSKPSTKTRATQQFKKKDISDVKHMLAEVSFIEGEESLRDGNLVRAIEHYRDAISYCPERVEFYIKLAEALINSETPASLAEAEQILLSAIDIDPSNMEPAMMLARVRDLKGKTRNRTGKYKRPDTGKYKRFETSTYPIVSQNLTPDTESSNSAAPQPNAQEKSAAVTSKQEAIDRRATVRLKIKPTAEYSTVDKRPMFLPKVKWAAASVLLSLVAFMIVSNRTHRLPIELSAPAIEVAVAADDLQFQWNSELADTPFVLEVYYKGDLVLYQITKEKSYKPDLKQKAAFQADQNYSWLVRTNRTSIYKNGFSTEPRQFTITRAITPPATTANEVKVEPKPSPVLSEPIKDDRLEPRTTRPRYD